MRRYVPARSFIRQATDPRTSAIQASYHRPVVRYRRQLTKAPASTRRATVLVAGPAGALLSLQRTAGNAAVAQLLSAPVVQRQAANFGLAKSAPTTAFAGEALNYWRSNPDKTLLDLGNNLMNKADDALAAEHVPAIIKPTFEPRKERGLFTGSGWTINIDLLQITKKPITTKLRDVTADEAGEVTDTCYHETRHAEQEFLQARVLASKDKKDAAAIKAALDIPFPVATAAFDLRASPPDKAVLPFVEQWNAFEPGGKHFDYKKFNEDLNFFVGNTLTAQPNALDLNLSDILAARVKLNTTIEGWKKDTMPFATKKASDLKAARRGPVELQILSDIAKLQQGFAKIEKVNVAFVAAEAQLRRTMAAVSSGSRRALGAAAIEHSRLEFASRFSSIVVAIAEFGVTAENVYRSYPHEADAHRVGHAARAAFAAAAKKRP